MTITTTAAAPRSGLPGHPLSWARVAQVTWLKHRATLLGFLVLFAVFAAAIVVALLKTHASYASYVNHGCVARPIDHVPCGNLDNSLQATNDLFTSLLIGVSLLPLLAGVFIGAPLVSRELESGTFRFAWTQGVGRTQLLIATLVLLAGFVTLATCALGLLLGGWYAHPFEVTGAYNQWQPGLFFSTGWMLAAWSLLALTLGTFLGAIIGRTVAAMAAATAAVGGLLAAAFEFLPRLLDIGPLTTSLLSSTELNYGSRGGGQPPADTRLAGGWIVRGFFTGPDGRAVTSSAVNRVLDRAIGSTGGSTYVPHWLASHHYTYLVAYQPATRYWMFQGAEGAAIIALAALFGLATIWYVRRV